MKRILLAPRCAWCEEPVDRAGLLVDGDDYYRAFYEAAQLAERSILLAGWQFDTDASLLRGSDAESAPLPVTLRAYLDALCQRNAALRVYVLAWDFHAVFALEREWMQELRFNWMTSDNLRFMFDSNHVEQGSHHQKFAVIDGAFSFLGGLDLCDHRWDDRSHRDPNPLRVSRGLPHKPFHDVQAYLVGREVGSELTALFRSRWEAAGGDPLEIVDGPSPVFDYAPPHAIELRPSRVSLSRTVPHADASCREICDLHLDAIAAAEQLIYVETQYFSSKELCEALVKRFAVPGGPPLDVVLVLNMEAETLKEEIAVGLAQAKVIDELRRAVAGTHHRLGVYYTVPETTDGTEPVRATYIHSKILVVDDRFLTVGSANLTNRSMSVDTELNVSMETADPNDALGQSIARARLSLLAEHLGIENGTDLGVEALVVALDDRARRREGRLRLHPSPTEAELTMLSIIDPQQLPFDPARLESHDNEKTLFVGGLGALFTRLAGKTE